MMLLLILPLPQMLLFAAGGCATESADMPKENSEPSATESSDSMSWEEEKTLLNELKDLALAQEGRVNLYHSREDGVVTAEARDEEDCCP